MHPEKPLAASDLEIRGTTETQQHSFVFSGRITNTGGSTAQEVSFRGIESSWIFRGEPAASGYTAKVPIDTIKNLKPGETRELSYVVGREFSYDQLLVGGAASIEDYQTRLYENDREGEHAVNRFRATELSIEPTIQNGK